MLKILVPNFHYRQRLTKVCQGGERKGKTAVKGLAILTAPKNSLRSRRVTQPGDCEDSFFS